MASRGDINLENVQPKLFDNWVKLSIEETIDKTGAFVKLKSKDYFEIGDFPVIDQGDKFISGYINDESLLYQGELPVIIFGDHTRNVKFIDFPFAAGADGTKILKPKSFYNPKFYHYYFKSLSVPDLGYSRHFSILKEIEFPLPPLAEQNRIVAKLDALFAQLETIKTSMAKVPLLLKDFRQQVLTQAVTGKLTEEWRKGKEFSILEELNQIEIFKGNKVKKVILDDNNWLKFELGEICSRVSVGHVGETSKYYTNEDSGIIFLRSQNVKPGKLVLDKVAFITEEFHNKLKKSQLKAGDLLIVRVGANRGDATILPEGFEKINCANIVFARPFFKYTQYLDIFFQSSLWLGLIEELSTGTAQGVINTKIVEKLEINFPSVDEQQEIVSRVESLFAKADAIEKQYETLKAKIDTLPQAILHKAFKGELTQQLDSDGDARELLREIEGLKEQTAKVSKKQKVKV